MNRLKNFLCTMDPFLATLNVITASLIGVLIYVVGIAEVITVFGFGLIAFAILALIGFGIYKGITYAQSKCSNG